MYDYFITPYAFLEGKSPNVQDILPALIIITKVTSLLIYNLVFAVFKVNLLFLEF